ncbi:MAG: DUF3267 domain-containing protein [Firmicutes bacterium]|nr:DUF3267 domain-containing protein [Bacillota bacterium]
MPHIIWCGNKKWDSEFPEKPLPENAVKIESRADIFTGSLIYGFVAFLFCLLIIFIKWKWLGTRTVYPVLVPLGVLIGLLLMPVHELLHAICYCEGQKVYIGLSLEKFAAFAVCHEKISRSRFIVMSLMPMLLGIIPMAVFLIAPSSPIIAAICIPTGIMGMLSPMPDYMEVHMVHKQVPKGAYIQSQNDGLYWFR